MRLSIDLNLETQKGREAAQDALAKLREAEWKLLVEFALAVVVLAEEVAQAEMFLIAEGKYQSIPRDQIPTPPPTHPKKKS